MRDEIIESLQRYVDDHIETGSFLRAVLENDLCEAFVRADDINACDMLWIVTYCWNHIPGACWGSKQRVKDWLTHKKEVHHI